jgi:Tfp pilus assembly protein PilO
MSGVFAAFLQLVRRWPFGASCVLLTVISGACAVFLWYSELPSKRASDRVSSEDRDATETKTNVRKKLEGELAEVRAVTEKIEANLVDEVNLAENLVYFYSLEEQTKVRLPELHQVSSPTTDKSTHYRRVPYGLRVAGTYDQVAAFLVALETGKRLAKITSFNLARTDPGGRTVALDLNVELLGKK